MKMYTVNNKSLSLITLVLLVIFVFNNCQPIGELNQLNKSSQISNGGTPQISNGENFFNQSLVPSLIQNCSSCHNTPDKVTGISAPTTIYDYGLMRSYIGTGQSSQSNPFLNKTKNQIAHAGGNKCPGGNSDSPCKELIEWVSVEYPSMAVGYTGVVESASPTGRIIGWAFDSNDKSKKLQLHIWSGPIGQGVKLVEVTANLPGNTGMGVGHYFSVDLPANVKNGNQFSMYIYAENETVENVLPGMPYKLTAYMGSQQGRDFYEQTVKPSLIRCMNCHSVNYDSHFLSLVAPGPNKGGTPLTNALISKANGELGHGGGSHCGGNKNSGLCANIRDWWIQEFQ